jgi:hypothetical protein
MSGRKDFTEMQLNTNSITITARPSGTTSQDALAAPTENSIKEQVNLQGEERPAYNSINPADFPEVPLGPQTQDLKGMVFGRLTVVHHVGKNRQQNALWLCSCSCGYFVVARAAHLKEGNTTSCGCEKADVPEYRQKRGPESKHPLYNTWTQLLNKIDKPAPYGRTNKVCARWRNSLETFVSDIGDPPSPRHRYERIDKHKPHSPSNWTWLLMEGRSRTQRVNNRWIEYQGEKLTLTEWSTRTGLHHTTIKNRLDRYGWSVEKALTTPPLTRSNTKS